ncbi:MAG: GrpB family protein [Planctomycetota bacterium]|jgi:GrpB-like predicted nucleotidyltransferase (UPF0157 family)
MKLEGTIGGYVHRAAEVRAYDGDYPDVAGRVAGLIKAELPSAAVEHVGSTAVPGCEGKGIVDLMVLYPEGQLESTKEVLDSLGFQVQPHREPFGDNRPMKVGAITFNDKEFQVHVHVIEEGNAEAASMIRFRDGLREDYGLMQDYIKCKKGILQSGTTDSLEYCKSKQCFIKDVLSCESR